MMLTVEVSDPEGAEVRLIREGIVLRRAAAQGKGETLRLISRVLRPADRSALSSVVVAMAGGTFSHIRGAAAAGNALALVLAVPAAGIRGQLPETRDGLRKLERRVRRLTKTTIVRPAYSREPNMTVKKSYSLTI